MTLGDPPFCSLQWFNSGYSSFHPLYLSLAEVCPPWLGNDKQQLNLKSNWDGYLKKHLNAAHILTFECFLLGLFHLLWPLTFAGSTRWTYFQVITPKTVSSLVRQRCLGEQYQSKSGLSSAVLEKYFHMGIWWHKCWLEQEQ